MHLLLCIKGMLRKPAVSLPLSGMFLMLAAMLLNLHIQTVHDVRDDVLPAAVHIPELRQQLKHLQEQLEVTELQAMLRGGSAEEVLRTFALPQDEDLDRLVRMLELIGNHLQGRRLLSSVTLKPDAEGGDDRTHPLTLEVEGTDEGTDTLLLLLELSGLFTTSDALTPEEIETLLALTEQENPAALPALEHFLSTDLLRYALEPKPFEEQLRKSFSSEQFLRTLDDTLAQSRLSEARRVLGSELGRALSEERLWPLRLLTIEHTERTRSENGRASLKLLLHAHSRAGAAE
jgi:hypothetical protein